MLISNVFELEGEQASMRCDIEKKENSIQAQTIVQLFLDVCIILSSMGGALWVRMDFQFGGIDTVFLQSLEKYAGINIVCTLLVFRGFRLYNSLWRYAGMIELKNIVYAVTGSAVLQVVGMHVLHVSMPRSYPVLYLLLLFFLTGFSRFIWAHITGADTGNRAKTGYNTHNDCRRRRSRQYAAQRIGGQQSSQSENCLHH